VTLDQPSASDKCSAFDSHRLPGTPTPSITSPYVPVLLLKPITLCVPTAQIVGTHNLVR